MPMRTFGAVVALVALVFLPTGLAVINNDPVPHVGRGVVVFTMPGLQCDSTAVVLTEAMDPQYGYDVFSEILGAASISPARACVGPFLVPGDVFGYTPLTTMDAARGTHHGFSGSGSPSTGITGAAWFAGDPCVRWTIQLGPFGPSTSYTERNQNVCTGATIWSAAGTLAFSPS